MGNCERFQKASDKNRGEVAARTEGIEVEEGNGDPDRSDEDHCPTSLGPDPLNKTKTGGKTAESRL